MKNFLRNLLWNLPASACLISVTLEYNVATANMQGVNPTSGCREIAKNVKTLRPFWDPGVVLLRQVEISPQMSSSKQRELSCKPQNKTLVV